MKIKNLLTCRLLVLFGFSIFSMLGSSSLALANGVFTETYVSDIVLIVVIVLGGFIALLGAIMVFRGIGGEADVDVSTGEKQISFKKVSQGVVVIIVGALILLGALYLGQHERTISGKKIDFERGTAEH